MEGILLTKFIGSGSSLFSACFSSSISSFILGLLAISLWGIPSWGNSPLVVMGVRVFSVLGSSRRVCVR